VVHSELGSRLTYFLFTVAKVSQDKMVYKEWDTRARACLGCVPTFLHYYQSDSSFEYFTIRYRPMQFYCPIATEVVSESLILTNMTYFLGTWRG
jgi:hypothetical protein